MQCIVLDVTDKADWREQAYDKGQWKEGVHIPRQSRASLIHPTQEIAEREAARLACESNGTFAVFGLIATVNGRQLSDQERVRGMGPCAALVPRWQAEVVEI